MKFLMLWSGDKPGMRKGVVQGVERKGSICGLRGCYKEGKVYMPDAQQVRSLLPKRYIKGWDRQVVWQGLPQVWKDSPDNNAPLVIRLMSSDNSRIMLQLYFQPLTKDS